MPDIDLATILDDGDYLQRVGDELVGASSPYIDVRRYGAVGDDIANDAAAIQAAIDAASAQSGGVVVIPADFRCLVGTRLRLPTGVTIRGLGVTATIHSTNAAGAVEIIGNNAWIEDLTVDLTGSPASVVGIVVDATTGPAVNTGIRRCRLTGSTSNCARVVDTFQDFRFEDNTITACASGLSINATSGSGIQIVGNTFRDVGLVNLQLYGPTVRYSEVLIADNMLRDFRAPATAIPIEVTGAAGCIIRGNRIATVATRGISTGGCTDLIIAANTITNQTIYAMELGNSSRVAVVGNVARLCNVFFVINNGWMYDLDVVGNIYAGSPSLATVANTWVMRLDRASRVRIANNLFYDWHYCSGVIRVGNGYTCEDVTVDANSMYCTDPTSPIAVVFVSQATRTAITRNIVRVQRDLIAGDDYITVVQNNNTNAARTRIVDNMLEFSGAVAAATNATGFGYRNTGAGTQDGLVIERNSVLGGSIGIYSNTTSTDARIADNNTRTCVTADTVPATMLVRRTMAVTEAAAAPTSGTWRRGDICWNTAPAAAGAPGWVCVTAGTPGTWKAMAVLAT